MGMILSAFERVSNTYDYLGEDENVLNYNVQDLYDPAGNLKLSAVDFLNTYTKSMIENESETRVQLLPLLQHRFKHLKNNESDHLKNKGFLVSSLEKYLLKYKYYTEEEIYDLVQLFMAISDEHGLLELQTLANWLDNFGDTTDPEVRLKILKKSDGNTEETRTPLDFDKFLNILDVIRREEEGESHGIILAIMKRTDVIKKIRALNTVQQLTTGFI